MTGILFHNVRVAIQGGGDLGSGVAYRLFRCGFPVLITELAYPLLLRRAVSFGSAAIEGQIAIGGVTARRVSNLEDVYQAQEKNKLPVLIDPEGKTLPAYGPLVVVDARMRKETPGEPAFRPPLLIGLGPGFKAPGNCDVVIETNRGHNLGRAIYQGEAQPDTGLPGAIMGHHEDRVLRAPADGIVVSQARVGAVVAEGQVIAVVNGRSVTAPFAGVLRGLIHDGVEVTAGLKIADIDPRLEAQNSFTISEKSLAVGGGVVEAVFSSEAVRKCLREGL